MPLHAAPEAKGFPLGPLTLVPGWPRRTALGKLIVPVRLQKDGKLVDDLNVAGSVSGRRDAGRLLLPWLPPASPARDAVQKTLSALLAWGAEALEHKTEADGPTIAEVVGKRVPDALRLAYRTSRGAWSEAWGREVFRSDVGGFIPGWLIEACAAAVDAPRDASGVVSRPALLRTIAIELLVLWSDLLERLPSQDHADLGEQTEAGRLFRQAMIRLWTTCQTFEVRKSDSGAGDSVASRSSLIARVKNAAKGYREGGCVPGSRERWREVQKAFSAWWRVWQGGDGEIRIFLALRWELAPQCRVELPGVVDQESLRKLGGQFGVLEKAPPVPDRLTNGQRLAVLSLAVTEELLADPIEEGPVTE
jgi:hypothetical protein